VKNRAILPQNDFLNYSEQQWRVFCFCYLVLILFFVLFATLLTKLH